METYKLHHPIIQKLLIPFVTIIIIPLMGFIIWVSPNIFQRIFAIIFVVILINENQHVFGGIEYSKNGIKAKKIFQSPELFHWGGSGE